jgi:hypothetical protein
VIAGGERKLATRIRWNRSGCAELYGGADDVMLAAASRETFMQRVTITLRAHG